MARKKKETAIAVGTAIHDAIEATFEDATPKSTALALVPGYAKARAAIAVARIEVQQLASALEAMKKQQTPFTQEQAQWLNDTAHRMALVHKTSEEERQLQKAPFLEGGKDVDADFMPIVKGAEANKKEAARLLARYEDDRARAAQTALLQAAAANLQGDIAATVQALETVNAVNADSATDGASLKRVWKHRVVDESAVPREWCDPSDKRIGAMARATSSKAQPIQIPGVEYYLDVEGKFK